MVDAISLWQAVIANDTRERQDRTLILELAPMACLFKRARMTMADHWNSANARASRVSL
jgi:hypothetical protein